MKSFLLSVIAIIDAPRADGLQEVKIDSDSFGKLIGKTPEIACVKEIRTGGKSIRMYNYDGVEFFSTYNGKELSRFFMSEADATARYSPVDKDSLNAFGYSFV